jgi:hypothetical protein
MAKNAWSGIGRNQDSLSASLSPACSVPPLEPQRELPGTRTIVEIEA